MVVFDEDAVGQAEPVISSASVAYGLFFEASPQWGCLACIQQPASGADYGVSHLARQSCNPAQSLGKIQCSPLARQKGPHSALQPEYHDVGFNSFPVGERAIYPDLGVEKFENFAERLRSGHNEGLAPENNGACPLIRRDNGECCHISASNVFEKSQAQQIGQR
jgi:hypothetical protein